VSFEVIPAIDLRGGRCVRLFQGDYDRETQYSDDPLAVARRWESLGAPRLHVVDLDGARDGAPANQQVIRAICAAVDIQVEVSGGIRDLAGIEGALAYGADRVQLGSAAVRDPELVAAACQRFPGHICVSIDARDGEVFTDGWRIATGRTVEDVAGEMIELGVPRLMFTDIGRDATLTEPNFDALAHLVGVIPVPLVASGGVAETSHLVRLATIGCEGAIVGKALYEGRIDLTDALAAVAGLQAC
jgi:phosphoribosylformimino-5-aminoimidazole carboxamide ribotide isomerase